MTTTLKWSLGNTKLKKEKIVGFGLPKGLTCPGAGACKVFCYAGKGNYRYPCVIAARHYNWIKSKRKAFITLAMRDLKRLNPEFVRIHDSGDFYSQGYLNKWFDICNSLPDIQFYAYTKSLHLNWRFKPSNLYIIQSYGGKYDKLINNRKPHARIFPDLLSLTSAGYVDCSKSDLKTFKTNKIGLLAH